MFRMRWSFGVQLDVHVSGKRWTRRIRSDAFSVAPLANEEYHEEFHRPPVGAATGFNGQEQVFATKDAANDMEQLQHRITLFQDAYPRIEKFYVQHSKVIVVDESSSNRTLNEDELYHEFSLTVETHVDHEQAKLREVEKERQRREDERAAQEEEEKEAKRLAEEKEIQAREDAAQVSPTSYNAELDAIRFV